MYQVWNEDEWLMSVGRRATGAGIIGMVLGFVIAKIGQADLFVTVMLLMLGGYVGLSAYRGGHHARQWSRRYSYRLPRIVWHVFSMASVLVGCVLGLLGWGILDHFLLVLSMNLSSGKGMVICQLVLLPIVGSHFAAFIHFQTRS